MVSIRFGELRVGTVSSNSGIFAGSNKICHFKHTAKQNQAFGTVDGEGSSVLDNHGWLDDQDHFDMDSTVRNRD
jgi:hypothetical protein